MQSLLVEKKPTRGLFGRMPIKVLDTLDSRLVVQDSIKYDRDLFIGVSPSTKDSEKKLCVGYLEFFKGTKQVNNNLLLPLKTRIVHAPDFLFDVAGFYSAWGNIFKKRILTCGMDWLKESLVIEELSGLVRDLQESGRDDTIDKYYATWIRIKELSERKLKEKKKSKIGG